MTVCAHLDAAPLIAPTSDVEPVCSDCVAVGGWWVHLRRCLTCEHMACCDSSPARHATAHFHGTGHPVVASAEPGEHWRWCYVDEIVA